MDAEMTGTRSATYCPKGYADDTAKPYIWYRDCRVCRNEAAESGKDTAPSR
jgi:hypothetical protein